MNVHSKHTGFTLIELLLVMGIIAVLSALVLIAVNPAKQLSDARSGTRSHAVREIQNAIMQYMIDGNELTFPDGIANAVEICQSTVDPTDCTSTLPIGYDLSFLAPQYVVLLPVDPNQTGTKLTGYFVYQDGSFPRVCSPVLNASCGSGS